MCLSIPSKVIKIDENNMATVEAMGVKREVTLDLISEEVNVGDYILIHIGYAMSKIDEESALDSLKAYEELIEAMDAENNTQNNT
ncbi:MAG: HypC/HybG/HupF family hydrogenase formation chaperone [Proteobacteria bacterium]|nr:MAG: HypC/HybG/HupF family hydrogenase formation chaperone [Pseudomonadota bacterium]